MSTDISKLTDQELVDQGFKFYQMEEYSQAFRYLKLAADHNYPKAFCRLAECYLSGVGCREDHALAASTYQQGMELGDLECKHNFATLLMEGIGVPQDLERGRQILEECAKERYPRALFTIGLMHENGVFYEQSYQKAMLFYLRAGLEGASEGYYNLAHMYNYGRGVAIDYLKALKYYELSLKPEYAKGYCNIAYIYIKGLGVDVDYKKAIYYLELGCKYENSQCYHNLGLLAQHGMGMPKDEKKAFTYFEKGAYQGNISCCTDLIKCYELGIGVPMNLKKSKMWRERLNIFKLHRNKEQYLSGDIVLKYGDS